MSILRKAMWPATVVAGMLLLIGAIGTATAPRAEAVVGDLCAIAGPSPVLEEDGDDLTDHDISGKLLSGERYLFVGYVEDDDVPAAVSVSIDDEEGDADITSFAGLDTSTNPDTIDLTMYTEIDGVDIVSNLPVALLTAWDAALIEDLEAEFDTVISGDECADTEAVDGLVIFDVTCEDPGRFELTIFDPVGPDNSITEEYLCVEDANTATLTPTPNTVESAPARGNISHSLLVVVLTDADGNPAAPGQTVDWSTDRCRIQGRTEDQYEGTDGDDDDDIVDGADAALFAAFSSTNEDSADDIEDAFSSHGGVTGSSSSVSFENDPAGPAPIRTIATAILHCEGAAPGVANVVAEIERSGPDLRATTTVTVVGPPQFITMTAAPNRLVCGEKATILVTVTDAINQKVSDHTRVELITNYGGVIGGTGGTLGFPGAGPVNPLSSGAAETFGGVATAYLLTSSNHVGAYEVVAASGGGGLGGFFSTPVITSQVTVTCTAAAAPPVTAPNTGTGSISPPNTGDAGLAAASSSTASLFVIAGAVAFVLAGMASFGYARR